MVRCFFITSPKTPPETSPFIASYALLLRWERLWVGERSSGARPLGRFACKEWRRLLHCCLCAVAGGNAVPPLREPATWGSSPSGRLGGVPKYGGVSGEVSGEMFGEHLTIQKSRVQTVFGHFGEVSAAFTEKLHRRRVSHKK